MQYCIAFVNNSTQSFYRFKYDFTPVISLPQPYSALSVTLTKASTLNCNHNPP